MDYKPLIIQRVHEEVAGFKTFFFEEGHAIKYAAGQYLTFVLNTSNEEIRRSYSIISAPGLNEPLAVGVKRIPNGAFSRFLIDNAQPGDVLWTTGPGGFFILPDDLYNYSTIFFFAAGSGITPVYSLIKTLLHLHRDITVILFYSSPSTSKTIFYSEILQLRAAFAQFHCEFFFSNAQQLQTAHLNRDVLISRLQQYGKGNYQNSLFYICGPESYMRMCIYTLQENKVPPLNIRRENFAIEKKKLPRILPPETGNHMVNISYGNSSYHFQVMYPDTILQTAKKSGISLPYSCETGKCGNCVARCIKGNVWMSYNEVLTDADLEKGFILTCVGHPVNGDVTLQIE